MRNVRVVNRPIHLRAAAVVAVVVVALAAGAGDWRPIGPGGGPVAALAFHPARADVLLAGSLGAGLYRSEDGGVDWMPAGAALPAVEVWSLLWSADDPAEVWAGTGGGLFVSRDGGLGWSAVSPSPGGASGVVGALAVDPSDPGVIYAATDRGLYRSPNRGGSWAPAGLADRQGVPRVVAVDPTEPAVLVVVIPELGIFRSGDGGALWRRVGPLPEGGDTAVGFAFSAVLPGRAYAAFADARLLVSDDRGISWQTVTRGLPRAARATALTVAADGMGGERVVLWTDSGPWLSLDAGYFEPLAAHFPQGEVGVTTVAASDPDRLAAALGDGMVWASGDGGRSWTRSTRGVGASWATAVAVDPLEPGAVWAATDRGLYRFSPASGRWSATGLDEPLTTVAVAANDPEVLYAGGVGVGIVRSRDGGSSWETAAPLPGGDGVEPVALAVDSRDPRVVWAVYRPIAGDGGLALSRDEGATWQVAVPGADRFVSLDPFDSGHLFAGGAQLWESDDTGETWRELLRPASDEADGVAFDPSGFDHYYVVGGGRLLRTTNGGRTWSVADRGLGLGCVPQPPPAQPPEVCGPPVSGLLVDSLASSRLLLGFADDGVWSTVNRGRSWYRAAPGLLNRKVSGLAFDPATRAVYAATRGGGVWVMELEPLLPPRRASGREGSP